MLDPTHLVWLTPDGTVRSIAGDDDVDVVAVDRVDGPRDPDDGMEAWHPASDVHYSISTPTDSFYVREEDVAAITPISDIPGGLHTRETCISDEAYIGNTVSWEFDGESAVERVVCPQCSRVYEYHYAFEGYFDDQEREYVGRSGLGDLDIDKFDDNQEARYKDGQAVSIPHPENERYEAVYMLKRLSDTVGSVIHDF